MADDEPEKRSKRWVWFVTLPVFYVLSAGPVIWIAHFADRWFGHNHGTWYWSVITTVYSPLGWVSDRNESFNALMEWYVDLLPFTGELPIYR